MKFKLIILSTLIFFASTIVVQAADLRVVTNRSSYNIGDTVTASLILSSGSESANAVSGTLNFPADSLQVMSLSKTGSIINLWVQEPAYSNTSGQVSFEGAILNPGFKGGSGRVLTVTFRARQAGTATLSYSTGSILANDGAGTAILKTLGRASLAISASKTIAKKEMPAPTLITPVPSAPAPSTVKEKTAKPKSLAPLPLITEAPVITINELKTTNRDNSASFIITADNNGSAIDHYEIQIDDGSTLLLPGQNSPTYHTPSLLTGDHLIIVTAVGLSGVRAEQQLTFTVSPTLSTTFFNWGNSLVAILSIVVPLALLLALLLLVLSSTKQNVSFLKRRLRKEVAEAEAGLHQAFDLIRDDLQGQVRALDKAKTKRKLTTAETKLLKTLKTDLTQAEKFIKKEIDDIGKQAT